MGLVHRIQAWLESLISQQGGPLIAVPSKKGQIQITETQTISMINSMWVHQGLLVNQAVRGLHLQARDNLSSMMINNLPLSNNQRQVLGAHQIFRKEDLQSRLEANQVSNNSSSSSNSNSHQFSKTMLNQTLLSSQASPV